MTEKQNFTVFDEILQKANEWSVSKLVLCIFLCLVTLTTILGNLIVLYVFAKSKRALRSPCHIILANLAVADLLVGLIVMPILTSVTVFDWKWYWGTTMCTLQDYVHFCLCAVSMLSMVAVCLERFVGVRYPMHHKRILTKRRMRLLSGAIWILAVILTAIPLSVWSIKGNQTPHICMINLRHDFIFFVSVSLYWIPITIIIYIYCLIYKTSRIPSAELMKWAKKSMGSTVVASTVSTHSQRRGSKSDEEKFEKARNKQTQILQNMTKLISVMFLFYGPLFFLFVMRGLQAFEFSRELLLAFGWARYFSSCTNTFLYIYVVPYYKKQLLRLLCNVRGSLNEKSEATSTGVNSEKEDQSSFSYSSSFSESTSKMTLSSKKTSNNGKPVNSADDSDKLKQEPLKEPSTNLGNIRWTFINEMDDIVAKIDKEMIKPLTDVENQKYKQI